MMSSHRCFRGQILIAALRAGHVVSDQRALAPPGRKEVQIAETEFVDPHSTVLDGYRVWRCEPSLTWAQHRRPVTKIGRRSRLRGGRSLGVWAGFIVESPLAGSQHRGGALNVKGASGKDERRSQARYAFRPDNQSTRQDLRISKRFRDRVDRSPRHARLFQSADEVGL